jgi:hypothetical protein
MARDTKIALDYFRIVTNMNDNLDVMDLELGDWIWKVWIKMLIKIYGGKGYYLEFSGKKKIIIIDKDFGISKDQMENFLKLAFEYGVLDKSQYVQNGILTSKRIQEEYFFKRKMLKRNPIEIDPKTLLIDADYDTMIINSEEKGINSEEMTISEEETPKNSKEMTTNTVQYSTVHNNKVQSPQTPKGDSDGISETKKNLDKTSGTDPKGNNEGKKVKPHKIINSECKLSKLAPEDIAENKELRLGWYKWLEYKKDEHRFTFKSRRSEHSQFKHLITLSNNDNKVALAIIQQSIDNTWRGLFELKTGINNGQIKSSSGVGKVNHYDKVRDQPANF